LSFGEINFEPIKIFFILLLVQSVIAIINGTLMMTQADEDADVTDTSNNDMYART